MLSLHGSQVLAVVRVYPAAHVHLRPVPVVLAGATHPAPPYYEQLTDPPAAYEMVPQLGVRPLSESVYPVLQTQVFLLVSGTQFASPPVIVH